MVEEFAAAYLRVMTQETPETPEEDLSDAELDDVSGGDYSKNHGTCTGNTCM